MTEGRPRLACDEPVSLPQPPGVFYTFDRDGRTVPHTITEEAYAKELLRTKKTEQACRAEAVRFTVLKTLKGPTRSEWIERNGYIDVVDRSPNGPLRVNGKPAYRREVSFSLGFYCGLPPARRLSSREKYLIFLEPAYQLAKGKPGPLTVSTAYLATLGTPFLGEAARLAADQ